MKRFKNIETNKKNKNNSHNSSLGSERSELSTKTLFSDNDRAQTSFEYLKDNTRVFFEGYPNILI